MQGKKHLKKRKSHDLFWSFEDNWSADIFEQVCNDLIFTEFSPVLFKYETKVWICESKRYWTLITNSYFISNRNIIKSLQTKGSLIFKLCLYNLVKFIVRNIKGLIQQIEIFFLSKDENIDSSGKKDLVTKRLKQFYKVTFGFFELNCFLF